MDAFPMIEACSRHGQPENTNFVCKGCGAPCWENCMLCATCAVKLEVGVL